MTEPAHYRGRMAPSPVGYLHRGHAATFHIAQNRARAAGGTLVLRIEDLDPRRCRPKYDAALIEDMQWAGLEWQEGPYRQSERMTLYQAAWERLASAGLIYPCICRRVELARALRAARAQGALPPGEQEPVYPRICPTDPKLLLKALLSNMNRGQYLPACPRQCRARAPDLFYFEPRDVNWRFRTTPGQIVEFSDVCAGHQAFQAWRDFGDFLVWRRDGYPSYQLAIVVDDAALRITEVVRGAELLATTAPQLLLYRALGLPEPAFYHAPLVTDEHGHRLVERAGAHSLRSLRAAGIDPATLSM